MGTLHCVLENGVDLYVNKRQKIRHYRARSTEERRRKKIFYFARCVRKLALYSDVIHSLDLEISRRTRWWCLKCVIVYLARDMPAFVMYCVYGASRSSLLIESTHSMIMPNVQTLSVICSQLNNKPRVVVTDFMLQHTCSIIWLHSLSGVIRSLFCNPQAFSPGIIIISMCTNTPT